MLSAVIFDMDGVIIDSEPLHTRVVIDIMKDFGIDISWEDMGRFAGNTNAMLWKTLTREYALDRTAAELGLLQHEKNLEILGKHQDILIPGVEDLLKEIKGRKLKTAIASSSNLGFIEAVVSQFKLSPYFDLVVSGQEVKKGKPAPDIFIEAAKRLDVAPAHCIIIEDSKHGVQAANNARIKVIGFINPNSGSQDLSSADVIVDNMGKINIDMMNSLL